MDSPDPIQVVAIHVTAKPGAALGDAMSGALIVASREWINVILTHNGKSYRIHCNELLHSVKEDE